MVAEAILVAAAQAGEELAFVELCIRNRQRAFSMIHRIDTLWSPFSPHGFPAMTSSSQV